VASQEGLSSIELVSLFIRSTVNLPSTQKACARCVLLFESKVTQLVSRYVRTMILWDVDIRSDNHVHYNKYLSFLEYHNQSRKLSVPEEHRQKLFCRGLASASSSGSEPPFVAGR
jgi:hypothetical protein